MVNGCGRRSKRGGGRGRSGGRGKRQRRDGRADGAHAKAKLTGDGAKARAVVTQFIVVWSGWRPIQHVQHHFKHRASNTQRNPRTKNAEAQCHGHAAGRNGGGVGSHAAHPPRWTPTAARPTVPPIRTGEGHPPAARPLTAATVHALAQPPRRNQRRRRSGRARHASPPSRRRG